MGQLTPALRGLENAIQRERQAGVIEPITWAYANRAVVAFLMGLDKAACEPIERDAARGVELSREVGNRTNISYSLVGLGAAHLQCGRYAEAAQTLEECLANIREHRVSVDQQAEACALMSLALLGQGKTDRALEAAQIAVASVERTGAALWDPLAYLALASSLIAKKDAGRVEEIERAIDLGLQSVETHGIHAMRPRLLECRANLSALRDDAAASRDLLAKALDEYRKIGASGHAERVSKLLR
jgi:tetratricopeptide (TPR) repeat protein